MATKSDKELIKQFLAGDQNAFEIFVLRYQDRVYRLACARLFNTDNAADAAQEVFLRAYTGFQKFHFRAEPFTWLYRTLENVCKEYNRKTKRDNAYRQTIDEGDEMNIDERDGSHHLHMQQIHTIIRQLPRRQQDVVLLRIFEGMSVEETAVALKCRQGTVKAHLHKAVEKLRGYLNNTRVNDNE